MPQRILTVAPMPPEQCAYALARYSRSPDSIADSVEWVRTHDSAKFLENFYFQYGHASIADLGHLVVCFEGISELAATEVEDEQLWDGQARSSRYQDFSKSGVVTPPELTGSQAEEYGRAAKRLLEGYERVHQAMIEHLTGQLPRPEGMKPEPYRRNIAARAFDVARYLLPLGIPTGVGQVTSIRTLEAQIRRLKSSEYAELRELADEVAAACARPPVCGAGGDAPAVAPTLARHVEPDLHRAASRDDLRAWAASNVPSAGAPAASEEVEVLRPAHEAADIVATLLYPVTALPFHYLYELACSWSEALRREAIDVALRSRDQRDALSRAFRSAPYAFDIVMDIGAYRDLHRHRRCQQFRQEYSLDLGFDTPAVLGAAGLAEDYQTVMGDTLTFARSLPAPGRDYILPFGTRSRFLFKMDFAEAEYISRLRSGVKGHFSYRKVAWLIKEKLSQLEPELARLLKATPPWVEDPLQR